MDEISSRASADDCRLIIWEDAIEGFRYISYEEVLKYRQESIVSSDKSGAAIGKGSYKQRLKGMVKQIPGSKRLVSYAKQMRIREVKVETVSTIPSQVKLVRGDTLVILWGAWHSQSYINYILGLRQKQVKLVQVIYDMLPLVTPQFSGHSTEWLMNYARTLYPICDLLISISEHTRTDTIKWLTSQNLTVPEIKTIRLGDDFHSVESKRPSASIISPKVLKSYILAVGTIEARKNHTLLYYTYKLAVQRKIDLPHLIIVGRKGWLAEDIHTLITTDPEVNQRLTILQGTSDEELSWLYENCLFSIYPSFYEGWGLPIAESIARGVPCIASNTSSMPEIAGSLISYFSPNSSDECLDAIRKLLKPGEIERAKKKIAQYKPVAWDETFGTFKQYVRSL